MLEEFLRSCLLLLMLSALCDGCLDAVHHSWGAKLGASADELGFLVAVLLLPMGVVNLHG